MNRPSPVPGLPPPSIVGTTELGEDQLLVVERDARARVLDLHQHASVVGGRANPHLPTRRRILDGIVDEVLDDLAQAFAIASHLRQRTVHLGGHAHLVLTELRGGDDLAQQIREIDVAKLKLNVPASIRDVSSTSPISSAETGRLVADEREKRLTLLHAQLAPPCLQCPGRADDRRHRAAQLVGDERDEVGAKRREPAQLLRGRPLCVVGPDVLHSGRHQPSEQRDELTLLRGERIHLGSHEPEHPDRARAHLQRREHAAVQTEGEQVLFLGIALRLQLGPVHKRRPREPPRAPSRARVARNPAGRRRRFRAPPPRAPRRDRPRRARS